MPEAPPPPKKKPARKAPPAEQANPAKPPRKRTRRATRPRLPPWVPTYVAPSPGVTYRYGRWTFTTSPAPLPVLVLWGEGGRVAFELVARSNGWWHYRVDDTEHVVWPLDGGDTQDFFARPWRNDAQAEVVEVSAGQRFELWEDAYGSTLAFDDDALRVTFYDKRVLTIPRDGGDVDYDGRTGERVYRRA